MAELSLEQQRLNALRELAILDSNPEPEFDEIVHLAAAICGASISVVSLIDSDRQWFKAAVGLTETEMPRSVAFCDTTIRQTDLLLVEDARQDARFCSNPLVTGDAHIRFYAGFPVHSPDGHAVGTLCVVDQQPRRMSPEQITALRILAVQVSSRLELRLKRRQLEQALKDKEKERALASSMQRRFEQFMNNSPLLSYIRDADGRMLYYNQPLARQFNTTMDEMLGKTNEELWPAEVAAVYRKNDMAVLESGQLQVSMETSQNADGSWSSWKSYKFPCKDEHGNSLIGGVSVEVTEQLQREEELERVHRELQQANLLLQELASVDTLTGLLVRRVFDDELRLRLREASALGNRVNVMLLDVDNFKQHNDLHGHAHGDRVLQALGQCLRESLRPADMVARYGGEEFAVLLAREPEPDLPSIVDRLLASVRSLAIDGARLTISAGVCSSSHAACSARELMENADAALFTAKRAGKDRAIVYEDRAAEPKPFYSGGMLSRDGSKVSR